MKNFKLNKEKVASILAIGGVLVLSGGVVGYLKTTSEIRTNPVSKQQVLVDVKTEGTKTIPVYESLDNYLVSKRNMNLLDVSILGIASGTGMMTIGNFLAISNKDKEQENESENENCYTKTL